MTEKQFDPSKFVDREHERLLFNRMLDFHDHARVLAICDGSGMGKSHLLEMFRHQCDTTTPRIPVSLVDMKQLNDLSPMAFIRAMVDNLEIREVSFPNFTRYETARQRADFGSISAAPYLRAVVPDLAFEGRKPEAASPKRDLENDIKKSYDFIRQYERNLQIESDPLRQEQSRRGIEQQQQFIRDFLERYITLCQMLQLKMELQIAQIAITTVPELAQTASALMPTPHPMPPAAPVTAKLTDEQQETAQKVCFDSFFDDIKQHCTGIPAVLLVDSYEMCKTGNDTRLSTWIIEHFLWRYFFDMEKRPTRLLMVIAGRELPNLDSHWSPHDQERVVRSVNQLREWEREHIEQYFYVHGYPYDEKDVDALHHWLKRGLSLMDATTLIKSFNWQGG